MGATTFLIQSAGASAQDAFRAAISSANQEAEDDGLDPGYTGTIAEKRNYVMIPLPAGKEAAEYAGELIAAQDHRLDDKYGPAGCIACADGSFLFFGWAPE